MVENLRGSHYTCCGMCDQLAFPVAARVSATCRAGIPAWRAAQLGATA